MNNKKITIIFILIAISLILGIVGLTMAYFTSSTDFDNEFQTGLYQTEATETFTSPQNWLPGDTTPKTLTIKNTGNVDVRARVCINELWESAEGDTLPNEQNGERVVILNLANTTDWTKKGSCYEYNDVLEPGDETNSFIESVTFNPNIEANIFCIKSGNTKTCSSNGYGYDNATYTLKFRVDTVQANKASEVWLGGSIVYTNGSTSIGNSISGLITYNTPGELDSTAPFYLKHKVAYDEVTESYIEFLISDEMAQNNSGMTAGTYTLRGAGASTDEYYNYNYDSPYFEDNVQTLLTAFGSSNCSLTDDSISNNIRNKFFSILGIEVVNAATYNRVNCQCGDYSSYANADGIVSISINGRYLCYVYPDGNSECTHR